MTKDDITRMAREAGWDAHHAAFDTRIEAFANLVAEREREACAKLCDDLDDDIVDGLAGWQFGEAIRAREQS